jgi:hypothetical protein
MISQLRKAQNKKIRKFRKLNNNKNPLPMKPSLEKRRKLKLLLKQQLLHWHKKLSPSMVKTMMEKQPQPLELVLLFHKDSVEPKLQLKT